MTLYQLDVVWVAFALFSFDLKATKNLSDLPSGRKLGAEQGLTTPVVFSKEQTPGLSQSFSFVQLRLQRLLSPSHPFTSTTLKGKSLALKRENAVQIHPDLFKVGKLHSTLHSLGEKNGGDLWLIFLSDSQNTPASESTTTRWRPTSFFRNIPWSGSSNKVGLGTDVSVPEPKSSSLSSCSPRHHPEGWRPSSGPSQHTLHLCLWALPTWPVINQNQPRKSPHTGNQKKGQ